MTDSVGFLFPHPIARKGCWKGVQHGIINRHRPKKAPRNLFPLVKGPGNGGPTQIEYRFDNIHTIVAKHGRKIPPPLMVSTGPSGEQARLLDPLGTRRQGPHRGPITGARQRTEFPQPTAETE